MKQLLRDKIKYVFVIFNENHSFDNEYGTFPGVDGLYSTGRKPRGAAETPGFIQIYTDTYHRTTSIVRPFRLGPNENSTVTDSVDHSHRGLAAKLHVVGGLPLMDGFAQAEFSGKSGSAASVAKARQFANLVMSHIDCDTIPFYWRYANRFTIFDKIFATEDTPSTPNAIAMIAGQSGETQWVKHGAQGTTAPMSGTINGQSYSGTGTTVGLPVLGDATPYWGSEFDATGTRRQPTAPIDTYGIIGKSWNVAPNLTSATVPLTAMGKDVNSILQMDKNRAINEADIQKDIPVIAAHGTPSVAWRWYQNGYDREPGESGPVTHANFIAHHEGPQYFGYIADDTIEQANLEGEGDFFADLAAHKLPPRGGIIYVRGGLGNLQSLKTPIQNPSYPRTLTPDDVKTIQTVKSGDDDHPAYTDRQISEAMNARVINAIASDPTLWSQSAIILTYDESDGFYDHVPPRILSYGPDSLPLARGIRVPLIVISPYARAHAVSHAEGDHNAVIETINDIFSLPALSSLPDEAEELAAGNSPAFNKFAPAGFQQSYLGPRDTNSPITDSLMSAFDPLRLRGIAVPLPASYASIPDTDVNSLPHFGGKGCKAIGIVPEDQRQGIRNEVPVGFNPLPATLPRYNIPSP